MVISDFILGGEKKTWKVSTVDEGRLVIISFINRTRVPGVKFQVAGRVTRSLRCPGGRGHFFLRGYFSICGINYGNIHLPLQTVSRALIKTPRSPRCTIILALITLHFRVIT